MGARITRMLFAATTLWATAAAAQEIVTVGLTADCDIQLDASLSAAPLNAAFAQSENQEFRLALAEVRGNLQIQELSTAMRGGYATCASARGRQLAGLG